MLYVCMVILGRFREYSLMSHCLKVLATLKFIITLWPLFLCILWTELPDVAVSSVQCWCILGSTTQ